MKDTVSPICFKKKLRKSDTFINSRILFLSHLSDRDLSVFSVHLFDLSKVTHSVRFDLIQDTANNYHNDVVNDIFLLKGSCKTGCG